jgi:hypothetical protein
MNTINGLRVFVSRPKTIARKRSLWERLTSRPLFEKYAYIDVPAIVASDKCVKIGDDLHCGEVFYDNLKKQATVKKSPFITFEGRF